MSGSRVLGLGLLVLAAAFGGGLFLGLVPASSRAPGPQGEATAAHAARAGGEAVDAADHRAIGMPVPQLTAGPQREVVELTQAQAVLSSWTTFDAAVDESRRTGKAILLDFNAEWCPPCRQLKRELFDDPSDGREVCTTVVPVSLVDRTREDGTNAPDLDILQRRFGIDAFPTLIVYSPSTGREQRLQGYAGREATLRWIVEAAATVR